MEFRFTELIWPSTVVPSLNTIFPSIEKKKLMEKESKMIFLIV